jgi:hypothetical protein
MHPDRSVRSQGDLSCRIADVTHPHTYALAGMRRQRRQRSAAHCVIRIRAHRLFCTTFAIMLTDLRLVCARAPHPFLGEQLFCHRGVMAPCLVLRLAGWG